MSKIRFKCFNSDCEKSYKVPQQYAGKKVKCKKCGATLKVPPEDGGNSDPSGKSDSASSAKPEKPEDTKSKSDSGRAAVSDEKPTPKPEASSTSEQKPKVKGKSRTGTVIIEVPDLGGERKIYEAKREVEDRERGKGTLVLFKDGKPTKSFRLEGKTRLIGRSSKAHIRLEDETVSKRHVKIEVKLGNFIMTDLKSSNGLIVNSKPIRRVSLRNGDIIQLGQAILRIDCG